MPITDDIKTSAQEWTASPFDSATQEEIRTLLGDAEANASELTDRFYKRLAFGTGGMRGIMGAGTNRMNDYTIAAATQGLANYIKAAGETEVARGVVVSFDSRNNSERFAGITAAVFAGNGIPVSLFPVLHPVPCLAYAVRSLGCAYGVMITASHNPPEYNGYKVFGPDGGQVVAPHDKAIIEEVNKVAIGSVDYDSCESCVSTGSVKMLGEDMDTAFNKEVAARITDKEAISRQKDIKIVYTPIHGSGNLPVRAGLESAGFENILIVKEQELPDGNFPTVAKPNPEEGPALKMAVELAEKEGADLVLATDPDADRVGIAVRDLEGRFILMNGNQTGSLLVEYVLASLKKKGALPADAAVVSTIVTTALIKEIAEGNNAAWFETLTGFKHIGTKIRNFEEAKAAGKSSHTFVVGGEESYGYLIGDFVRDKDAVTAACVIAEMAAVARDNGSTIYKMLLDVYRRYACYREDLISHEFKGKEGMEKMVAIMDHFRGEAGTKLFTELGALKVLDYRERMVTDTADGSTSPLEGFPVENVLQILLRDGSKISLRPSGTEPKIKFYFSCRAETPDDGDDAAIEAVFTGLGDTVQALSDRLLEAVEKAV